VTAFSIFGGSRSALFYPIILSVFYLIALKGPQFRIRLGTLVLLVGVLIPATLLAGAAANAVRPLWRSSEASGAIREALVEDVVSGRLLDTGLSSLGILMARLADLYAPFAIVNDGYVYDPWPYVNPLQIAMRTINDVVPGDVFQDKLTINQLFEWIYRGTVVSYSSEFWSGLALPYLYFGFFGAPLFFLCAALASNVSYGGLIARIRNSPSFALFAIALMWEAIANGTVERMIVVDIVRVVITSFLFSYAVQTLQRLFSVIAPVRHRLVSEGKA
jgi:hypothetical protein